MVATDALTLVCVGDDPPEPPSGIVPLQSADLYNQLDASLSSGDAAASHLHRTGNTDKCVPFCLQVGMHTSHDDVTINDVTSGILLGLSSHCTRNVHLTWLCSQMGTMSQQRSKSDCRASA